MPDTSTGPAARVFNSTIAAWAISAAWEVGALDELGEHGKLDAADFARRNNLHLPSVLGMFTALATVDAVALEGDLVLTGPSFDEFNHHRSMLHWLSRGNAALLADMPRALRNDNRTGRYYSRDAAAISYACREANERFFDPAFDAALSRVDFPFHRVVDLGSGSGERLIRLAERHDGLRGWGIDIAKPSLAAASAEVARRGLGDRIEFIEANVLDLAPRPEFAEVELLTSFMMGHDFWPRESCVATLRRLREAFPAVRRFILGDNARTRGVDPAHMPIFTLGFELAHDLMDAYVPTLDEWESVFEESGWRRLRTELITTPHGAVVIDLE